MRKLGDRVTASEARADAKAPGLLRKLLRESRGATMAIVAIAMLPAIAAVGSAVDMGRIYMVRSQLQAGADAAALAGARAFNVDDGSDNDRDIQVDAYFSSNFPEGYMGTTDLTLEPEGAAERYQIVDDINLTTITAQATVPMAFMQIWGAQPVVVQAVARAEAQPRPLEVMVVLDNTGSMRFNLPADSHGVVKTRMVALKESARSFVNILYQGGQSRPEIALGFVNYDVTANVGTTLLAEAGVSVRSIEGFNAPYTYTDPISGASTTVTPGTNLSWRGCVMNDQTVRDLSADITVQDAGAWDITRTLPGEGLHPAVAPYYVPPMWVPNRSKSSTDTTRPTGATDNYYDPNGSEQNNNLFRLNGNSWSGANGKALANSPAYKNAFFQYYKWYSNGTSSAADDVIVRANGTDYDPTNAAHENQTTRLPIVDYTVNYNNIPEQGHWTDPTSGAINSSGGITDNINANRTPWPSPNWQCPAPAVKVAYGRTRTFYNDFIANSVAAIYPGNGTIHHAGLLWGYRLLVRDDKWSRTNPTTEEPRRALVFMTDGETALADDQNGYKDRTFTWYGRYSENSIAADAGNFTTQSERRFAKICEAMRREANPPDVYIIALATTSAATLNIFNQCAGAGRVYRTSDPDELKAAFDDIASELVDLHLVM